MFENLKEKINKKLYKNKFFDAVLNKDYKKVEYYASKIGDIDVKNKKGFTALYEACYTGDEKMITFLLKKGARQNIKNKFGLTPIDIVCDEQRLILNRDNLIEILLKDSRYSNYEKIDEILQKVEIESESIAFEKNETYNMEIAKMFVKNMKNINWQDRNGNTVLHKAIINDYMPIIDIILDRGIDVNIKNNEGQTALHLVTLKQDTELVKKIMNRCKDNIYSILSCNNNITNSGKTALDITKSNNNKKIERLINKQNEQCIIKVLINRKSDFII